MKKSYHGIAFVSSLIVAVVITSLGYRNTQRAILILSSSSSSTATILSHQTTATATTTAKEDAEQQDDEEEEEEEENAIIEGDKNVTTIVLERHSKQQQEQQQQQQQQKRQQKKKKTKNLLLTAYVTSSSSNNKDDGEVDNNCRENIECLATQYALHAATECAARSLSFSGQDDTDTDTDSIMIWDAMVVTDLKEFEKEFVDAKKEHEKGEVGEDDVVVQVESLLSSSEATSNLSPSSSVSSSSSSSSSSQRRGRRQLRRRKKTASWNGPGPFPHYVKIHILERLLLTESAAAALSQVDTINSNTTTGSTTTTSTNESSRNSNNMDDDGKKKGGVTTDGDETDDDLLLFDWIAWIDADVRIINASYPVAQLLDPQTQYERIDHDLYDSSNNDNSDNNTKYYYDNNDVSLVVMLQYNYDNIINDLFFVKNTMWGRRFVQAWKYFTLNTNSTGPNSITTCGNYDQCPFGIAMLQLIQDYYWILRRRKQQRRGTIQNQQNRTLISSSSNIDDNDNDKDTDDDYDNDHYWSLMLQSRPYNATLEELAFRSGTNIQDTLLKEEISRLTIFSSSSSSLLSSNGNNSNSNNNWKRRKDTNTPVQVGPILLVPTWEGGLRLPSSSLSSSTHTKDNNNTIFHDYIPSSLMIEPSGAFVVDNNDNSSNSSWPFAIHAKYNRMFCHRHSKYFFDFEIQSKLLHHEQCTTSEISAMWNERATCWSRWQKTWRSID